MDTDRHRQQMADWKRNNRERYNEYQRTWRAAHPDRVRLYNRKYRERIKQQKQRA